MKKMTSKKILFVTLQFFAIALSGAIIFQLKVNDQIAEIESLQRQISENEDTANVVTIKRDIDNVTKYSDILEAYSIDEDSAISFIETIEALGRQKGIELTVQNVDVEDKMSELKEQQVDGTESTSSVRTHGELTVVLGANSGWTSLMEFLILLQNVPYNTYISDLKISSARTATGAPSWLATMQLIGITN